MVLERIIMKETDNTTSYTANRIVDWLEQDSQHEVFYLVPEHIKFDAELKMLAEVGKIQYQSTEIATTRLQVFSFSRLAWYFLKDESIVYQPSISKVGLAMIVQKVLLQLEDQLRLFRQEAYHKGFIEKIVDLFIELRQGAIEPEDFATFFDQKIDQVGDVQQRLKEFGLVYTAFQKELVHQYTESEERLIALAEKIFKMDLSKTLIIIDQYYYFNAFELQVIEALMRCAHTVVLQLSLTKEGYNRSQKEANLFTLNSRLLNQITELANAHRIEVKPIEQLHMTNSTYHSDFLQLENYWLASNQAKNASLQVAEHQRTISRVFVHAYNNKQQEIQETLATIKKLVHTKGYRYADIQLLTRTLEQDKLILEPLLQQYSIPYFIDQADTMEHHALLKVILSIFNIDQYYWRYEDIMALLRSELCLWFDENQATILEQTQTLLQFRATVDHTENMMLANGYQGSAWAKKQLWGTYEEAIDEDSLIEELPQNVNEKDLYSKNLRDRLVDLLLPFYENLKTCRDGKEAVQLLYCLFEQLKIPQSMMYWRDEAAQRGDVQFARRQEQVWNQFILILDEYVEIFGTAPFDATIFEQVLTTGFEQASYQIPPTTLDQIVCTGYDAIRYAPKKVTFVLGATRESMPRLYDNTSLLTDEERDLLSQQLDSGRFLRPSATKQQTLEPFVFYKTLTSATDYLFFSYATTLPDQTSKQHVSPYVERIAQHFNIAIQDGVKQQQNRWQDGEFYSEFELFSNLLTCIRQYKYQLEQLPSSVASWSKQLRSNEQYRNVYDHLINSVFRMNQAIPLPNELAEELYGKQLFLSVSQIELFFADPFSHYLKYGLQLKERQEFTLTTANAGEYFHELLDQFIRTLYAQGIELTDLSEQQIEEQLQLLFQEIDRHKQYAILNSSPRFQFVKLLLQETVFATAVALKKQQACVTFKPFATEYVFGLKGSSQNIELNFALTNGNQIQLRGKIDRIDKATVDQNDFVSVIDYKSGKKEFKLHQFLAGVQLQLFTYLTVAQRLLKQTDRRETTAFGAFYLHVHQPTFMFQTLQKGQMNYEEQWLNTFRLNGMVLADPAILEQMNPLVNGESRSIVLPYKFKKDGTFSKESKILTVKQFAKMQAYVEYKIKEAGERILAGDTQIAPIQDSGIYAPSVNGIFSTISQFDATNPENNYHPLEKISVEEAMQQIDQLIGNSEEENHE